MKDWSLLPFVDMISILGPNLRSLHLEESSPFKLFHYTQQLCPNLYALSVEGVQSSRDLQCFVSRDLRSLRLIETHIDLSSLATASSSRSPPKISSEAPNDITGFGNLPKLIKLEFMDSIEPLEIVPSILALPPQLLELELRIDYKHSHDCIDTIGKSLPELLSLILHLRDSNEDLDDDDINDFVAMQSLYLVQVSAMKSLAQGCPKLQCFEVLDRLSGGLSPEAFSYLVNFKCLEHICLLYSANFVHALPQLLTGSKTIAEVIFFEDASYFSDPPLDAEENADDNEGEKKEEKDILSRWEIMCRQLERIGEIFSSVTLELRDDSAWLNMT